MFRQSLAAAALATALFSPVTSAADYSIEVINLTHGNHFTPLLIAAHPADSHIFQSGQAASASVQAMAEGGDISGIESDLGALGVDMLANPAGGLLAPGSSASGSLSTTSASNTQLSVVAMILPTNDAFIGLDSVTLPTAAGTYSYYLNGYDAGTEANDEIINGGGAPGNPGIPAAPGGDGGTSGTGVAGADANNHVHIHRGVLGDTDATGGASDLNSTIHRWLNPVAKVIVTVQ